MAPVACVQDRVVDDIPMLLWARTLLPVVIDSCNLKFQVHTYMQQGGGLN